MKNQSENQGKLRLNREVVRQLTSWQASAVRGGTDREGGGEPQNTTESPAGCVSVYQRTCDPMGSTCVFVTCGYSLCVSQCTERECGCA